MRRKKRSPSAAPPPGFQHQPFRSLRALAPLRQAPAAPAKTEPPPSEVLAKDEASLFEREMASVRRLGAGEPLRVEPKQRPARRPIVSAEAEALAELCDLVAGNGAFDLADATEYVEGIARGVDRRLVRRLRRGDFAYQRHIDLHGMTAEEARAAVDHLLSGAYRDGLRCVLIIHGRGLNSRGQIPVLKKHLTTWLARGGWSRLVLAFTSARACDGGLGAMYVLLRRRRGAKKEVHVTEGAKW